MKSRSGFGVMNNESPMDILQRGREGVVCD